jgi:hypothetical protein
MFVFAGWALMRWMAIRRAMAVLAAVMGRGFAGGMFQVEKCV